MTIHLKSFDRYRQILRYQTDDGKATVMDRDAFEATGLDLHKGAFTTLGSPGIFGVYASQDGPVVFLNADQVLGRFGVTSAELSERADIKLCRFTLIVAGEGPRFHYDYPPEVLGANPYDTEPEDVDLAAWLAPQLSYAEFYRWYRI